MPLYIVLSHTPGESCFEFGTHKDGDRHLLKGCICEFDGGPKEAQEYFAKQSFYGGDESAKPEDYKPQYGGFESGDSVTVVVAPFDKLMKTPLDGILGEHNAIHRKIDEAEQEKKERSELERLSAKYS